MSGQPVHLIGHEFYRDSGLECDKFSNEVLEAMYMRCEENGHDWKNIMVGFFTVMRRCKWCALTRK